MRLRPARCTSLGSRAKTTGLVIATRISENPSASILVLETGHANINEDTLGAFLLPLNPPPLTFLDAHSMSGTLEKTLFSPDFEWSSMTVGIVNRTHTRASRGASRYRQ